MPIDARPSPSAVFDDPTLLAVATLRAWQPVSPEQDALRAEYLERVVADGAASLRRDGGPEHLTASCFIFSPDLANVLLCYHRKGDFWVQLGGHVEPEDPSLGQAAYREALEEGGIAIAPLVDGGIVDLNRHGLGSAFGRCSVHWDVGFAAVADPSDVPVVSDESEDVAWWPVDGLPERLPPQFAERLETVLMELEGSR